MEEPKEKEMKDLNPEEIKELQLQQQRLRLVKKRKKRRVLNPLTEDLD